MFFEYVYGKVRESTNLKSLEEALEAHLQVSVVKDGFLKMGVRSMEGSYCYSYTIIFTGLSLSRCAC